MLVFDAIFPLILCAESHAQENPKAYGGNAAGLFSAYDGTKWIEAATTARSTTQIP